MKPIATLVAVAIFLALCVKVAVRSPDEPQEAAAPPLPGFIDTMTASTKSPAPIRSWMAVVIPSREVVVTAPSSATLENVVVRLGDDVTQGEVIAQLDSRPLDYEVARVRARLLARQAERREAGVDHHLANDKRQRTRALDQLVPAAERIETQASALAAAAAVQRANAEVAVERAELDRLGGALRDAAVTAPFAGEITALLVDPGTRVAAGEPILRMVDRAKRIRFAVPIDDVPPAAGAVMAVQCDLPRRIVLSARVTHVAPHIDGAARVVLVEADLREAEGVRIGTQCRAQPAA